MLQGSFHFGCGLLSGFFARLLFFGGTRTVCSIFPTSNLLHINFFIAAIARAGSAADLEHASLALLRLLAMLP